MRPQGQDVLAVGEARVATYNGRLDAWLTDPSLYAETLTGTDPQALIFKGKLDCCQPTTSSIWNEARANQADISRLLEENKELYQRYLVLQLLHGYYETARPSFYEPFYILPQHLRALFLANAALQLQSSVRSEQFRALEELSQDVQLWRAVLEGEGTLTAKIVAAADLHADFLLLADMLADPSFDPMLLDGDFARMLIPFPISSTAPVLFQPADPWHLIGIWDMYAAMRDQGKPVELQYMRGGASSKKLPPFRIVPRGDNRTGKYSYAVVKPRELASATKGDSEL